ncbi:MAG: hypothetical protein HRT72_05825 [Flavobacteriales bacterium]|nr:hypothetical protein [Flavobacteriales bacterium]
MNTAIKSIIVAANNPICLTQIKNGIFGPTSSRIKLILNTKKGNEMNTLNKLIGLCFVALLSLFVACGQEAATEETATEEAATEEAATETEVAEEADAAGEELAEHVCNEGCSAEGCKLLCGEKGHECTEECGHDHSEEGESEEGETEEAAAEETIEG